MELLQDSEPGAIVAAPEGRAALTERLQQERHRQEHLRAHPQQDEGYRPQLPLEELRLRTPPNCMQPVKRT